MVRARLAALAVALTGFLAFASAAQADDYIVVLKDGVSEPAAASDAARKGAEVFHQYQSALNGYAATLSASELAAVRADSRVDFVAKDRKLKLDAQVITRPMRRIDADQSSTRSGDGHGKVNINVAVIDTGIDPTHPDLNVVGGVDCAEPRGSGFDDPWAGHGTVVAGFIGALDDNFGVVGVAPGARLWAINVFHPQDEGFTPESAVICAVDWVTSTRTDKNKKNDIVVANSSLGGEGTDDGNCGRSNHDPMHRAYCRSTAAGVLHVVSAGNEFQDFGPVTPASYSEVLTATAMTDYDGEPGGLSPGLPPGSCLDFDEFPEDLGIDDGVPPFSNFATQPSDQAHTLAAPGVCVGSTFPMWGCESLPPGPDYCFAVGSGTSFSSPIVAGTAALCISTGKCSGTPKQTIKKLINDAARYNQRHPGYGFVGDPLRPISGSYYGWLIRAGLY